MALVGVELGNLVSEPDALNFPYSIRINLCSDSAI